MLMYIVSNSETKLLKMKTTEEKKMKNYKIFADDFGIFLDATFNSQKDAESARDDYIAEIMKIDFEDTFKVICNDKEDVFKIYDEDTDEIHPEYFSCFKKAKECRDALALDKQRIMLIGLKNTYSIEEE